MNEINDKLPQNIIKSFSIYGLFGTEDVHIDFDDNIKILIGENGIGKTQVLGILNCILTQNFLRLSDFPFREVKLNFKDCSLNVSQKEIFDYFEGSYKNAIIKDIIGIIGISEFEKISSMTPLRSKRIGVNQIEGNPNYPLFKDIASADYLIDLLRREEFNNRRREGNLEKTKKMPDNLSICIDTLQSKLHNQSILFFPTFRRVEEDLHDLGYEDDDLSIDNKDNRIIHFGMDDVQKRFNAIENKIDFLLKEGFTRISSEILSKLIKGFDDTSSENLEQITETDINIILARVGDQISEVDKYKIKKIVVNKEAENSENSLLYFLQALVGIYEKQKEFDIAIQKFREVCNSYLIGKKVFYDERNIKIYIARNINNEHLELNKLSSGEKQIISIFSKIYLSDSDKRFIVLFDEPELSLSMLWQKQLLPDIVNSNKCDFLLAVTHSPFIFDNELDKYAVGLSQYITPSKEVTA